MPAYSVKRLAFLTCHPTTTSPLVQGIEVQVDVVPAGALIFSYTLTGDGTHLRIPEEQPPHQVDGLWQHTCFELFVCPKGGTAYWEFNFSPSREWAVYTFHSYRNRVFQDSPITPPQITTRRTTQQLTLDVHVYLPQQLLAQPLQVGLSAVIEDDLGQRSYWALQHPSIQPDFHHVEAFALEIIPPHQGPTRKE